MGCWTSRVPARLRAASVGRAGRVRSSVLIATQVELAHVLGLYAHVLFSTYAAVPVSSQGQGVVTREGRARVSRVSLSGVTPACLHDFSARVPMS